MAPFRVLPDFLDAADAERLLAYVADREAAFQATSVGDGEKQRIDPRVRVSASLRDLGEFAPLLRARLRAQAAELTAALRLTPFETERIELELVAHGDGAFYRRHIDLVTGVDAPRRMVSGVYYFHRRPKGFAGGELRLYAIGDPDRFVDVEPVHNALLVFPAWAPHEVRRVSCASGAFMDSRFAVNCWFYARRLGAESPNEQPSPRKAGRGRADAQASDRVRGSARSGDRAPARTASATPGGVGLP
jgi:SM-20-related protein